MAARSSFPDNLLVSGCGSPAVDPTADQEPGVVVPEFILPSRLNPHRKNHLLIPFFTL